MNTNFKIVIVDKLNINLCMELKVDYILAVQDEDLVGVVDIQLTSSYYDSILNEFNELSNSIFDSCYNGILALDNEKKIVIFNKSASLVYDVENLKANQIVGQPLNEVLPESPLNYLIVDSLPNIDHKCSIGLKTVKANRTAIKKGDDIVGSISIFEDITKSESASKELQFVKDNEEYLESIIENSYDGIYITDRDSMTLKVNKSYERITGIPSEKLIGKYMKDLVDEGLLSIHITDKVVTAKKPITINQTVASGKNIIITGSPIFDKTGNVSKVITNVRDITELIELEKQLLISKEMSSLYQKELFKEVDSDRIVCNSETFKQTLSLAQKVSSKDSTVLVLGETGVGKEVIARYIHSNSKRKSSNYIKVNCGSIPANLLESELFGYVAGAFTGANPKGKIGLFELAHNGTLFLDEIGELPLDLQSSLLRVLQDGEIIRVGDTKSKSVDVRIIAATNRNLEEMISLGTFRSDLYYRLNVFSITIPPLRERKEDIPALAEHFIRQLNKKYQESKVITSRFIDEATNMNWPGNIREMANFIEKQFIISDANVLDSFSFAMEISKDSTNGDKGVIIKDLIPMDVAIDQLEKILLQKAMEKGHTTYKAAELLNMSQPTFFRKYKEHFGKKFNKE